MTDTPSSPFDIALAALWSATDETRDLARRYYQRSTFPLNGVVIGATTVVRFPADEPGDAEQETPHE